MKIKEYPSIPGLSCIGEHIGKKCVGFLKNDGSQIRSQFSPKRGWYKWGTRRRLFDKSDPDYGPAISIFEKKYADELTKIINDTFPKNEGVIAFFEYFGPHSFAGWHKVDSLASIGITVPNNEPMDLVLFDVNVNKKGFVDPFSFIKIFSSIDIAEVLYEGELTEEFVKDVQEGKYPVREGVVVKGGDNPHKLWMNKIKTFSYLTELRERFGVGWRQYE